MKQEELNIKTIIERLLEKQITEEKASELI
jgi:hypothetical protein